MCVLGSLPRIDGEVPVCLVFALWVVVETFHAGCLDPNKFPLSGLKDWFLLKRNGTQNVPVFFFFFFFSLCVCFCFMGSC